MGRKRKSKKSTFNPRPGTFWRSNDGSFGYYVINSEDSEDSGRQVVLAKYDGRKFHSIITLPVAEFKQYRPVELDIIYWLNRQSKAAAKAAADEAAKCWQ